MEADKAPRGEIVGLLLEIRACPPPLYCFCTCSYSPLDYIRVVSTPIIFSLISMSISISNYIVSE